MNLSEPSFVRLQYQDTANLEARIALHARFSTNSQGWFGWLFDHLDLPPDARILEIGGGTGLLWQKNRPRIPSGWQIVISDASAGMVDKARSNLIGGRSFEFAVIDAQTIPFANHTFDAVLANHMLYHVPDRPRALAEMQRVLRSGGRFFASTNGETHLRELDHLAERFDPGGGPWTGRDMLGFSLENGAAQLEAWFSDVQLDRYLDDLVVTEAQPFVAYVFSMATERLTRPGPAQDAFVAYVEQEIARRGAIRIHKDTGLFVACQQSVGETTRCPT